MCSIAAATLALTAVSTGIATTGVIQQTRAANEANRYNAKLGEIRAQDAEARGLLKESRFKGQVSQLQATQRSALAASGIQVDVGTAGDIVSETAFLGNLDALTIRHNTAKEAFGFRAQRTSRTSPLLAAGGTLLTGISQFGSQFLTYRQAGLLNNASSA